MAKSAAVWGIDIGQCALKALRCRANDSDPTTIVADAFDYIEYPKILSQPEADPTALVQEALQQFLSRNDVARDQVAISVSGQSGLARFIKLPPVESKKIPDIVKYEAKQQIPFALEDVVWDYQQMAGGSMEEGFALETEVGLFAMKRDQVFRSLRPFDDAGIPVNFIQLTPLAIYNYIVFDVLNDLPASEEYDPENPPPSTVVISLGTDTTDLVVTNGFRVWQRSIPIGGSHFTKALTKEMKLTFSKAEHLKRNATKAPDPKAAFQAMRPVFSDLLTEIQRSIGYFSGIDRNAKIGNIVALGNALKLPGLQRYLSDNLQQKVHAVASYRGLVGGEVVDSPRFKENLLSFSVSYGLCLQGLGQAKIATNLLPPEIVTARLIREKKPWTIAAAAALLVGCTVNFMGHYSAFKTADIEGADLKSALSTASSVQTTSSNHKGDYTKAIAEFTEIASIGENLISNVEGRILWLELYKAINAALPSDPPDQPAPEKIAERNLVYIESLDCESFEDLNAWYAGVSERYEKDFTAIYGHAPGDPPPVSEAPAEPPADDAAAAEAPADAAAGTAPAVTAADPQATDAESTAAEPPSGPGWVIQLRGYHYHNDGTSNLSNVFLRNTLLTNLHEGTVALPNEDGSGLEEVPFKALGITHPVIVWDQLSPNRTPIYAGMPADGTSGDGYGGGARPSFRGGSSAPFGAESGQPGVDGTGEEELEPPQEVKKYEFVIQFCWKRIPPSQRRATKEQAEAPLAEGTGGPARDSTAGGT